jgi:hypothetical protein
MAWSADACRRVLEQGDIAWLSAGLSDLDVVEAWRAPAVSETRSHGLEPDQPDGARRSAVRTTTFDFRRGGFSGVRRTSSNKAGYAKSSIG